MADFVLTTGQQQALDQLLAAVNAKQNCALHGPAGTGKTTLTGVLIERLLEQGLTVVVAAPTHKAVGVLRNKVPASVACCTTIASLLGLKPQAQGRWIRFVADPKRAEKRGQLRGVDVLIVDESSMLSEALGSDLTKLAASTSTTVVCVGDASQLGPVDPPPEPGDEDAGSDDYRGVMAEAFLDPPGGVAALTEIVRHQGPVLELATAVRQCKTAGDLAGVWPTANQIESESRVIVHDHPGHWLHAAKHLLCDPRWPGQPDAARIVCWSNKAVERITHRIRAAQLGAAADRGWVPGEILSNGDAIQQPSQPIAAPLAPSSCEWRVVDAETVRLQLELHEASWHTPKRKEARTFSIGCDIAVQQLQLEPLVPGELRSLTVLAPIPGDTAWADRIRELKASILKIEAGKARTKAWAAWHQLRSHCCDLRSAAVLTVHRAQGSTFRRVWVYSDLAHCTSSDALPLHYTALTRASQEVHLIRRGA